MTVKYRKKPVVIEAMQYTQENRDEVIEWSGATHTAIDEDGAEYELATLRIQTHGGEMPARVGDWVIKSRRGGFRTCRAATFISDYEEEDAK